jgi:prepilin-type N-terminal cleavage/methylation domain-containing protein
MKPVFTDWLQRGTAGNTRLRQRSRSLPRGFTILELMISIGIFAMVLTAIYMTWIAILRGSQAGLKAAAEVQRSRIAVRTLEDAFSGTEFFMANMRYYLFFADTSGDFASVSLATRVPDGFLGAQQTKMLNQNVRRINFYTRPGKDGMQELMMTELPILAATNNSYEAYTVRLAKDVSLFQLAFFDPQKGEWLDEWKYTNQLPKMVQIALGLGKLPGNANTPSDVVYSLVALPSVGVGPNLQRGGMGQLGGGMTNRLK